MLPPSARNPTRTPVASRVVTHHAMHVLTEAEIKVIMWTVRQLQIRGFRERSAFQFQGGRTVESAATQAMLGLADTVMHNQNTYSLGELITSVGRIQVFPSAQPGEPMAVEVDAMLRGLITDWPSPLSVDYYAEVTRTISEKLSMQ